MIEFNTWLEHWEPLWLFLILFIETIVSSLILWWTVKEFKYDEKKDLDKKQKRIKTTKKTTTKPGGETITEESTETHEPFETKDSNEGTMRREASPK